MTYPTDGSQTGKDPKTGHFLPGNTLGGRTEGTKDLVLGWNTRIVALLSGSLLTTFALTMTVALGVKAPLNLSVFSAAAGALLLGVHADVPFSVDEVLRRNRLEK